VLDDSNLYKQDCRTRVRNVLYESDDLISELETQHTAVVGTVGAMLGLFRHVQATLYLFQKHLRFLDFKLSLCSGCCVLSSG
jgi:hypothetical protein